MSRLVLTVASSASGWTASWTRDGSPVGSTLTIDPDTVAACGTLAARFAGLFGGSRRPNVPVDALRRFGRELAAVWVDPVRAELTSHLGATPHDFAVVSRDPRVLNQPWELLELTAGTPLGCDAAWSLLRMPVDRAIGESPLEPGPLRILFVAAAPTDQARLDYQHEEDAMLRSTSHLSESVAIVFGETGTAEELAELVTAVRPHVVHLSGHGKVDAQGRGTFAFEDERGRTDARTADQIVADVFRGSPVRCVFWNGCETAQAAVTGLCQALVESGVPLALGWAASVADDRATEFAREFYHRLAGGESTAMAAAHAREFIRRSGRSGSGEDERQDATFALLQMYAGVARTTIFDAHAPLQPYRIAPTASTLLGDGIQGLREGFVGRRRQTQRLIPALRDGETTVALLTGIGGQGKSTLATRTANRLEPAGFRVMPVRTAAGHTPAESARQTLLKLIDAMGRAFLHAERKKSYALLTDTNIPLDQRLRLAVDGLNEIRALFVLDNFEDALALETRAIADPELVAFYTYLLSNLTRGSRLLVTSRYVPEGTPLDSPNIAHISLPEFDHADFIKFLRRNDRVDARMRRGELPSSLLTTLLKTFGGTPYFLVGIRTVLASVDPDELQTELEGDGEARFDKQRDAYYERIFAPRLVEALPPGTQTLVTRVAVSDLPLPLDGIASLVEMTPTETEQAIAPAVKYALLTPFDAADLPTLYHVPGLLRSWLAGPERLDHAALERAHRSLANFWRKAYEADRETDLRVTIEVEIEACREHARAGNEQATFQWASVRSSRALQSRGLRRQALSLLEKIPTEECSLECLVQKGSVLFSLGDWQAGRACLERALSVASVLGEQRSLTRSIEATALHELALIDLQEGKYHSARERLVAVLAVRKASGDIGEEATTLGNIASIDLREGDLTAARRNLDRALELFRGIHDADGEANVLNHLATIDYREGSSDAARTNAIQALSLRQRRGDRVGEAAALHQLASLDLADGHLARARRTFVKVLALRQDIGDRVGESAAFHQLGTLADKEGRSAAGVRLLAVSVGIKRLLGHFLAKRAQQTLMAMCRNLRYSQEQFEAANREAGEGYQTDRGWGLVRAAFPDEPPNDEADY